MRDARAIPAWHSPVPPLHPPHQIQGAPVAASDALRGLDPPGPCISDTQACSCRTASLLALAAPRPGATVSPPIDTLQRGLGPATGSQCHRAASGAGGRQDATAHRPGPGGKASSLMTRPPGNRACYLEWVGARETVQGIVGMAAQDSPLRALHKVGAWLASGRQGWQEGSEARCAHTAHTRGLC